LFVGDILFIAVVVAFGSVWFWCGNLNDTSSGRHYLLLFEKKKRCATALAGRRAAT